MLQIAISAVCSLEICSFLPIAGVKLEKVIKIIQLEVIKDINPQNPMLISYIISTFVVN